MNAQPFNENPELGLDQAAEVLGKSRDTILQWIYRSKRSATKNRRPGDEAFKGLPFHQVVKGSPYKFKKSLLEFWYNNKYNVGSVNPK